MGNMTNTCLTDCSVQVDPNAIIHAGPALIQIPLDPSLNVLQSTATQPRVGLLDLVSRPLKITVTNPDGSNVVFTEPDLSMMAGQ